MKKTGPCTPETAIRQCQKARPIGISICLGLWVLTSPAMAAATSATVPAHGKTTAHRFNIAGQPLYSALSLLAEQAGIQFVYTSAMVKGLNAPAVTGEMSTEEALKRLLEGSGLGYHFSHSGTVVLERKSPPDSSSGSAAGAPALGKVTVSAKAVEEEDPAETYQAVKSTAGSKIPVEIERVPQSIQVVTEKTIHDTGAIDVGQTLKNVPSANVGQSRFSRFPKWTVRGFPLTVQRNGFRQIFRTDADASSLSNVENFEVLKGPGSSLYGQGGLGGLANIVTKRPKDHFQGYVSGTYGEYDMGQADFDVSGALTPNGALAGRVTGQIERSGSFINFQNLDRENLGLNLSYDDGGPVRAHLVTEWIERRTLPTPGLPALGTVLNNGVGKIARKTYLGEPGSDKLDINSPAVQAWLDIDIAEGWTLSPRFQYLELNGYQNQIFLTGVQPDGITVNRVGRENFAEHDRNYIVQLDLKGKFDTFGLRHQFLAGLEYEDHRWDVGLTPYVGVPAINALNPVYLSTAPTTANSRLKGRGTLQDGSFYLQDLVSITPELDFLGGMRHTQISGSTDYWFGTTDLETDVTTYNLGATYKVWNGVSLFAGYGTGTNFDSFGVLTFNRQQYRPIETDQKEMGVKLNLVEGLTGTVALFEIFQTNMITPDPKHPGFDTQLGEARSRGVEADFNWQVTDEWNFQGGYAFLDAHIIKSGNPAEQGNRLRNVAEHQANLWTHYQFKHGVLNGLGFGAGANYVGKRPGENDASFELPAYTTVDLSTSYQWKNFKAELFALNMLDKHYFTASDFTYGAVFPGTPRTVFGRITINF